MFVTEKDAERYIEMILKEEFHLLDQVHLKHWSERDKPRIDYMAAPKHRAKFPCDADFVGIEIKKGYDDFRDFTAAVYQCIAYRESVLNEKRTSCLNGKPMPFVFLFPAWEPPGVEGRDIRSEWAEGVYRQAGRFDVGFIHVTLPYWATNSFVQGEALTSKPRQIEFRVSTDPFWTWVQGVGCWPTSRRYLTDKRHGRI